MSQRRCSSTNRSHFQFVLLDEAICWTLLEMPQPNLRTIVSPLIRLSYAIVVSGEACSTSRSDCLSSSCIFLLQYRSKKGGLCYIFRPSLQSLPYAFLDTKILEAVTLEYDRYPAKEDCIRLDQAHHLSMVLRSIGAQKNCHERDQIKSCGLRL